MCGNSLTFINMVYISLNSHNIYFPRTKTKYIRYISNAQQVYCFSTSEKVLYASTDDEIWLMILGAQPCAFSS